MAWPGLVLGLLRITLNFVILLVITCVRWYVLTYFVHVRTMGEHTAVSLLLWCASHFVSVEFSSLSEHSTASTGCC